MVCTSLKLKLIDSFIFFLNLYNLHTYIYIDKEKNRER